MFSNEVQAKPHSCMVVSEMNKGTCKVCKETYKLRSPHKHSKDVTSGLCGKCNHERERRIIKYA
jgi:hypothetical protein